MLVDRLPVVRTVIAMLMLAFLLLPEAAYAEQADGEYTIGFNIMHADKKNASIAEGYWNQPAKLTIKDGGMRVQTTINKHAWVTEFATRYNGKMTDVKTISVDEAANERLTEFQIANLTDLVESSVSVTIDEMDYDHSYTMYFKFKPETLTLVKAAGESAPAATKPAETKPAATTPPKTATAPTNPPAESTETPVSSIKPSASAVPTNQTAPSPVPTSEADEQEFIDSNANATPSAIPVTEPASVENDNQSEEAVLSESDAGAESVDPIQIEETDRNGNQVIVTVVLVVLLAAAAAAAIVYKTRRNKK
ncbi:NEAT domain-containing protein [Paenibacillus sp. PAMC21692]|uniref:NEAT domain-containing protein n=1 Tax=Paenibacillus sp. PAMC21692 TaxID=2762320 RepID=UPI00164E6AA6|nr:NEAT domain-containing protein [Paenibacillus sp. PAMC21692]QNK59259.1 NEAT domain-containing protein [Paenibacillus sp. PAMC21692]